MNDVAADTHELYRDVILRHAREPESFGKLDCPTHRASGINPLCGDSLELYLNVDDDEVIQAVRFDGESCAIATASASMLTRYVQRNTVGHARELASSLETALSASDRPLPGYPDLQALTAVYRYPTRIQCAMLAWKTLVRALDNAGVPSSTATVTTE